MIPFIWHSGKGKLIRTYIRIAIARDKGGVKGLLYRDIGKFFCMLKLFCILIVVVVIQLSVKAYRTIHKNQWISLYLNYNYFLKAPNENCKIKNKSNYYENDYKVSACQKRKPLNRSIKNNTYDIRHTSSWPPHTLWSLAKGIFTGTMGCLRTESRHC
jgi:hypothetical protein